jgi:hypothetical protein
MRKEKSVKSTINQIQVVKMALELMKIDYDNWNVCLKECPSIRGDRYNLSYYVKKITAQVGEVSEIRTETTSG